MARARTAKAAIGGKPAAETRRPRRRPALSNSADNQHFTHFDAHGQAHMVDVADKDVTKRVARAGGRIEMRAATLEMVRAGGAKKGDVLGIARVAAIMAAKRTADMIPLCHPLPLTRVAVEFALDDAGPAIRIEVTAETLGRTGVEMEALAAVTAGLLTIYDMCKAVDRGMRIEGVRLMEKSGGRSGHYRAAE